VGTVSCDVTCHSSHANLQMPALTVDSNA
jgi:hypothetical protein